MLCFELFESPFNRVPEVLSSVPTRGPVEACETTAIINPSSADVARMLAQVGSLRALAEPGRFVIWSAEAAMHQPIQIALQMDNRSRRYVVTSSTNPGSGAVKVGRYFVTVIDASHQRVKPEFFSVQMKYAFGLSAPPPPASGMISSQAAQRAV